MKKDIHPKYKKFTITLLDGSEFITGTAGESDKFLLELDFRNHPAWTGGKGSHLNEKASQVAKFNKKFGNIAALKSALNPEE